ncbi:endonuclease [Nonlabens sp. MIC269]|uniref:endonuclease/exonuclease/phosphatase family protein n=1 Tax=Nonlabens sp. MIC269 TaxID=1476901 RepID=UPI00071F6773|nr:endonuclease/exonuclease/phosphatase family protein [Nonlabens sp. MIC269]ALM19924.1 endonuclease [Nonlabens sp. MIC269]
MNWRKLFQVLGIVAALLSLMPLVAADFWWIRIFDFPHLLLTSFTFIAIVLYFFVFKPKFINDYTYILILLACFGFQLTKIIPYTFLYPTELLEIQKVSNQQNDISLYVVNVLQKNKDQSAVIKDIKDVNPDIVLALETDQKWANSFRTELQNKYPFMVEQPQDNTYGMLLYSKLPLSDTKINFLVDKEIPSIETKATTSQGEIIQLYAVHPTPPMPQHNPMSSDRDKELMLVALKAHENDLPVVVMGDFNDVIWSDATQLTQRIGKLLDPKKGRGFYNSYHAEYFPLRWPLDHILVSNDFRFVAMGTRPYVGSDHYPLYLKVSLESEIKEEQPVQIIEKQDWQRCKDQMSKNGMSSFLELPNQLRDLMN